MSASGAKESKTIAHFHWVLAFRHCLRCDNLSAATHSEIWWTLIIVNKMLFCHARALNIVRLSVFTKEQINDIPTMFLWVRLECVSDSHVNLLIDCLHSSFSFFSFSLAVIAITFWKLSSGCKWIHVRIKGHLSNAQLSNFIPHQCQILQNLFPGNWISIRFIRKSTCLHIESVWNHQPSMQLFLKSSCVDKANGTLQQTNDNIYPSTQCRPRSCTHIACYTVPSFPLVALSCCDAGTQWMCFPCG